MEKKIVCIEAFSEGKKDDERKNQDGMYIGENFVAVIDGVSRKSSVKVMVNGEEKEIKIADIIAEAIGILDSKGGKEKSFGEVIEFINFYIKWYLQAIGMDSEVGKLEATAVIYSKHHNKVLMIGDCGLICDGERIGNPLEIDKVYREIRNKIIEELLKEEGYKEEDLIKKDIARDIIAAKPEELSKYVKSEVAQKRITEFRTQKIREALVACGFTEEEIDKEDLIGRDYYNPRNLQKILKNNTSIGTPYGYAVLNGKDTEFSNCRIVDIPEDAEDIILHTDGFSSDAFKKNDIRSAILEMRKRARKDPLSTDKNPSTHVAVATNRAMRFKENLAVPATYRGRHERAILRIDDLTAVRFRLVRTRVKDPTVNLDDGR